MSPRQVRMANTRHPVPGLHHARGNSGDNARATFDAVPSSPTVLFPSADSPLADVQSGGQTLLSNVNETHPLEATESRRMKRIVTAFCMTAAVIAGVISTAPGAAAADGWCGKTVEAHRGGYSTQVPATSGGSTSCVMGRGSSGEHVSELQRALAVCHGLDTGTIDGVYGAKTEAAVRTLQSWNGLNADGIYGPNTRNVVSWRWYAYAGVGATCSRI